MSKKKTGKEAPKKKHWYETSYLKLLLIPIILLILSIASIAYTYSQEDSFLYRDITLRGGLSATVQVDSPITAQELTQTLENQFSGNLFQVSTLELNGQQNGFIVDTNLDEEELKPFLEQQFSTTFIPGETYTSNFISPTLSDAFFKQAMLILLFSFILMSLVIFLYFREVVPSGLVVLSALFDLIVTVGILNIMQVHLSIAGIGTLLMIIGYSVDTDVLLTNRLVKEKYHAHERFDVLKETWKTGSLMTLTTGIAALTALMLTNSSVIAEVALIIVIGLLVDYVSTWLQNTAILMKWLASK